MGNRLRIVVDTNALLVAIPSYSKYHWLYKAIIDKELDVFITNEILNEYEEKIEHRLGVETAQSVIRILMELENVYATIVYYKFQLITADPDDDKFADCAFASNAHFLITNDKHFNILEKNVFPKIRAIKIEDFKNKLMSE